ncbi:hypothetical protein NDU88_006385 [Pleurodeles waltl]|uniref:Uncharacterized protein n=1 Tax=Pleurodeles waltl TaxID=8319 RepID=A0AAV7TEY8_PLEWA|nr:hypothetical protein NDU88_006385 [Pleurodeles waltl]
MGAESSALRGYTLQEPSWTLPSGLSIHPALLRDGRLCTVFIYQPDNQDKVHKAAQVVRGVILLRRQFAPVQFMPFCPNRNRKDLHGKVLGKNPPKS